jgi:hypothetical protein
MRRNPCIDLVRGVAILLVLLAGLVAKFFSEPANERLRAALASRREQDLRHLV